MRVQPKEFAPPGTMATIPPAGHPDRAERPGLIRIGHRPVASPAGRVPDQKVYSAAGRKQIKSDRTKESSSHRDITEKPPSILLAERAFDPSQSLTQLRRARQDAARPRLTPAGLSHPASRGVDSCCAHWAGSAWSNSGLTGGSRFGAGLRPGPRSVRFGSAGVSRCRRRPGPTPTSVMLQPDADPVRRAGPCRLERDRHRPGPTALPSGPNGPS